MNKESLKIIFYFLGTVFLIYGLPRLGMPVTINQIAFLVLAVFIFFSRDDLFWLCWFFVLNDAPGRLFSGGLVTDVYRLPLYNIAPNISLVFQDIMIVLYIIKVLLKRTSSDRFLFSRHFQLFFALGLLYFAISFAIGISLQGIINTLRAMLSWCWIFILPRYITRPADLRRVFSLIAPFAILALVTQIQTYITGTYLHDTLSGASGISNILAFSEEQIARVYSAHFISFMSLVLSLHYLTYRRPEINPNLLIFLTFVSSTTIFLSGTRGWIIVLLILLSSFFSISGLSFFKQLIRIFVIVGLSMVVLTSVFPRISAQGSLVVTRLFSLQTLASGDLTAGGTLSRLTERGPRVMSMWRESPVIGWAFSDIFYAYDDVHVGNQTILLNLGLLGFIAIVLIYLLMLRRIYSMSRINRFGTNTGKGGVFVFAMVGLFFAHSTSGILWGYQLYQLSVYLFWAFFFSAVNAEMLPQLWRATTNLQREKLLA